MSSQHLAVIILAAGKGTRMKSDLPKVLHPLANRPMVLHVLDATAPLNANKTVVLTGHKAEAVEAEVNAAYPQAECIQQTEQLGTGHAVLQAKAALADFSGTVLILCGDCPLIETSALTDFLAAHHAANNTFSQASAHIETPAGLGRIIRSASGDFVQNKEDKDCSAAEKEICEINTGIYAADSAKLFDTLSQVTNDNANAEYYLPDIMGLGKQADEKVDAIVFGQPASALGGINNRAQLAACETILQNRLRQQHMLNGVTLLDPATTYFSADTEIGQDVTIEPNVVFKNGVTIASGTAIKAFSHLEGANIAEHCTIGPFARLRPGTQAAEGVKIGNFVETKKASLGVKSSVGHLSYMGDITLGDNVNIGGGTIAANYNHHTKAKAQSTVAEGASVGANSVLVAPVHIGKKATTGAGTVIRRDVADFELRADKPEQVSKKNYSLDK